MFVSLPGEGVSNLLDPLFLLFPIFPQVKMKFVKRKELNSSQLFRENGLIKEMRC